MNKYLITFVYFETKQSINNLIFFIKNGITDDENIYYNFIMKSKCSVNIPKKKNINILFLDKGYDFTGYAYSLKSVNLSEFHYFIFINDTVRGPFIPRYLSKSCWYIYFTSLINEKTKLVGPTINYRAWPYYLHNSEHIQSMCFGLDKIGLDILIKNNIFSLEDIKNKNNIIKNYEIRMSQVIIKNGFKIDAFHQSLNNKIQLIHSDIHIENKYFGITINPLEVMFIKTNRINNSIVKSYTNWNF